MTRPSRSFWLGFACGLVSLAGLIAAFFAYQFVQVNRRLDAGVDELRSRSRILLPAADAEMLAEAAEDSLTASYDWTLRDRSGRSVSFDRYRGRGLMLVRWATWCAPCRAELPGLRELARSLAPIPIVMVSDEDPAVVARFLDENEPGELDWLTYSEGLPSAYWSTGLPVAFVVGCGGEIVLRHQGGAEWNTPAMRELLGSAAGC